MSPSRNHHRSSAQLPRTQNRSNVRLSPDRRQPRSTAQGQSRIPDSPNTLTGRDLLRALNKANERGTQGKEMYVNICIDIYTANYFFDRTGPLAPYVRAGKLIPRLIDPWLDLDLVFIRGLTTDGLLAMTDDDEDDDESEMDE